MRAETTDHQAARRYDADLTTLAPLAGGHVSAVYQFERAGRAYVLRLTPPDAGIDSSAMRAILTWMSYLCDHGASVARPVLSKRDELVETIRDGEEAVLVTAVAKAPGVLGETLRFEQWTPVLFDFDDCLYGWYVMDIAMSGSC